jgi:hypothetical protein
MLSKCFKCLLYALILLKITFARSSCHNYPKIIGGTNEATFIYDIAAHMAADIIVMGGSTLDSSLTRYSIATTGTYYPLIAAYYMSSTQAKWAHTD